MAKILYFSLTDWLDIQQRAQHIAEGLSTHHPIIYTRPRTLKQARNLYSRWGRKVLQSRQKINDNLTVFAPLILPLLGRFQWSQRFTQMSYIRQLQQYLETRDFQTDILWVSAPNHARYLDIFPSKYIIYDCMDDYPLFYKAEKRKTAYEDEGRILNRANLVLTTSKPLQTKCERLAQNVRLVPNGVNVAHFQKVKTAPLTIPPDLAKLSPPIIGYYGSLSWWFDTDAVAYAANEHPEWSFVLIGPIHDRHIHFDAPNVHWLGAKPYMDLPAYLKYFDVAIMPFIPGEMIQSVDPVKIYEYMAAGKAIVTTELPSILPFGQALRFYKSRQDFVLQIAEALDNSIENEAVAKMLDIACSCSWEGRIKEILDSLVKICAN